MILDTERPIIVSADVADKLREWFASGRGVKRWENAEIASGAASHVFTPGDKTSPGWRYVSSEDLTPADLRIDRPDVLQTFRGRLKVRYYGPDVAETSRRKADRLAAKYDGATWTWGYDPDLSGYVQIQIVRAHVELFT